MVAIGNGSEVESTYGTRSLVKRSPKVSNIREKSGEVRQAANAVLALISWARGFLYSRRRCSRINYPLSRTADRHETRSESHLHGAGQI